MLARQASIIGSFSAIDSEVDLRQPIVNKLEFQRGKAITLVLMMRSERRIWSSLIALPLIKQNSMSVRRGREVRYVSMLDIHLFLATSTRVFLRGIETIQWLRTRQLISTHTSLTS